MFGCKISGCSKDITHTKSESKAYRQTNAITFYIDGCLKNTKRDFLTGHPKGFATAGRTRGLSEFQIWSGLYESWPKV